MKNTITLKSSKSKSLKGKLFIPGDKSISIRALLMSSICFGNSKISNLLESEDIKNTISALKDLGIKIIKKKDEFEIYGNGGVFKNPSRNLYLGNSGTGLRLLVGLLSTRNINATFTGDAACWKLIYDFSESDQKLLSCYASLLDFLSGCFHRGTNPCRMLTMGL